jgi:pyruvate-ferredoxin/flavodoxin oxidoreductase
MTALTENRRSNWRRLQELAGIDAAQREAAHRAACDALTARRDEALAEREASLDAIARAMTELATAVDGDGTLVDLIGGIDAFAVEHSTAPANAAMPAAPLHSAPPAGAASRPLVAIDDADRERCTNCKTCYQDIGDLVERTTIVVDGQPREIARVIPGVLEHLTVTPELIARVRRAAANCDAEIIRCGA